MCWHSFFPESDTSNPKSGNEVMQEIGTSLSSPVQRMVVQDYLKSKKLITALMKHGVSAEQHSTWMETSEQYRRAILAAKEWISQMLQDCGMNWAINGVPTKIVLDGQVTGWFRKKEWRLLLQMLDRMGPEESRHKHAPLANITITQTTIEQKQIVLETILSELGRRDAGTIETTKIETQPQKRSIQALPLPTQETVETTHCQTNSTDLAVRGNGL